MKRIGLVLLLMTLFVGTEGMAEIYHDIRPYDTRADVQKKFPGASFDLLHPAWAKKSDLLYKITGSGLSGTLIVKFTDGVEADIEFWRDQLSKENSEDQSTVVTQALNEAKSASLSERELKTQVEWVRWIPDSFSPVPLERLITLYGTPDKSGVDDTNFQPYKHWNRGVDAYASDDGKTVTSIEYTFTTDERKQEWMLKHPSSRCDKATSLAEVGPDGCPWEWTVEIIDRQKQKQSRPPATPTPAKGR